MFLSLDDRFGSHVYLELSSDVDLNFSRIVYKRFKELFSEDSGRGDVIIPSSLLDDDFSDFWSVLQEYRSLSGDLEH
jgi:repressor of nif and glnA expression